MCIRDRYKLLTTGRDKLADLAQIIISKDYKRVMVFCNTKYNTGMLANQLARDVYKRQRQERYHPF